MKHNLIQKIRSEKCIIDCHAHIGVDYKSYLDFGYPYCMSFEDFVIRMKYLGIDHAVVMSFAQSSYYKLKPDNPKKIETCNDFSAFPYELENKNLFKEIYDIFPEYADRVLPFAQFDPSRKIQEQVELLEKLHSTYHFFGLKTCTTYIQSFVKDLESYGRPILDFAVKHNLPIIFHSSYDKRDPWASAYDIVNLAEKHPEVRICIAHTARLIKSVLEKAATLANCFVDLSAFDILCLLVRMEHRAIPPRGERIEADYKDPSAVMHKLVSDYPDTLIWGTDTPGNYYIRKYFDMDGELIDLSLKSSFDTEIKIVKNLESDEIEKITYKNPIRFLFS